MSTNHDEIRKKVHETVDLINFDDEARREALGRATEFLVVTAMLIEYKLELQRKYAVVDTLKNVTYSKVLPLIDAKNITEKKALVYSDKEYSDLEKKTNLIDAKISWTRSMIKTLENAHVIYRQIAKED